MGLLQVLTHTAWEVAVEPLLTTAGLYQCSDLSYGRCSIPFSPMEKRLHENAEVSVSFGKVLLDNGKDWVWYQVWQDSDKLLERKGDMIFVHGTGVHSSTLASHSRRYLKAGYRLIVPDLVSHGYSSGLHVYQNSMSNYTEGLHSVLQNIVRQDDEKLGYRQRKWDRHPTFMLGLSFGGTVALHYALDYPHSYREDTEGDDEVAIDGIIAVGQILGYAPNSVSVPPQAASLLRFANDRLGLSRLEIVVPHKKALDKDPNVYKALISEDKRSHQGAFRVGHLKLIDEGIVRLHKEAKTIRHAIFLQQGGQDRVACHKRSIGWIRRLGSHDKRMVIYPICQHVIYRKAKTEEEDVTGRIACIEDNVEWMSTRNALLTSRKTYFYDQERLDRAVVPVLDRSTSWSSTESDDTTTTTVSSIFDSDGEDSVGLSTPEMTEATPPRCHSPLSKENYFLGPFEAYDSAQVLTHPLLSKAHKSTLPILAKLATHRAYRAEWTFSSELRPYDLVVDQIADQSDETVSSGFS